MRFARAYLVVCVAALSLLSTMVAPAAADESEVVIEGGGWGHGIGMSQYGAYGQALEGKTAEQIVGYYYRGSGTARTVDQVGGSSFVITDPTPLWVNLLAGKTVFTFKALNGALTVCQSGAGGCNYTVNPGEAWRFVALGNGTCRFEADGAAVTNPGDCQATVKGMSPDGARIEVGGLQTTRDEFARGFIRVRTPNAGSSFHVSLEINLEEYMYGLAEVPFSWHTEALRAQALAGRSYATWKLLSGGPEDSFSQERRVKCWCHMWATTADQSYRGWTNETAADADRWHGAVDSTAGTVITHPDASQADIVAAFYSSSTGGRTENNDDMWGGSPVSYLRSRPDPWSQDPAVGNPFGRWEFPFTEDALASEFGVDKVDGIEIVERYASGTPRIIEVLTRTGGVPETVTTSGPELYSRLGLRGRNINRFDYGTIPAFGGDFDGDGRSDVAMATGFNDAWWVGRSTPGEFAMSPWLNHSINGDFRDRVTGDFNGDGKDDVAAFQADSGKLLVGLSTGSRFALQLWARHIDPQRWGNLVVGDFDGNGTDDIAEYENRGERWRIYRLVDGKLVREFWYDFAAANPNWSSHTVGDYNGDGLDDILSLDSATGDLIVLFSDGSGMTRSTWQTLPNNGPWQDVQSADFTGDGIDDLGAYDPGTASWWVVKGRNAATAGAASKWFTYANSNQGFIAQVAGDFTGDGKADVAAYTRITGKLKILESSGTAFSKSVWAEVPARHRVTVVIAMDANGDGKLDVAAWDNKLRRWWVARNRASTAFNVAPWGTLLR